MDGALLPSYLFYARSPGSWCDTLTQRYLAASPCSSTCTAAFLRKCRAQSNNTMGHKLPERSRYSADSDLTLEIARCEKQRAMLRISTGHVSARNSYLSGQSFISSTSRVLNETPELPQSCVRAVSLKCFSPVPALCGHRPTELTKR